YSTNGSLRSGELLSTWLDPAHGDVAVIRTPKPEGFVWRRDAQASTPVTRGSRVWLVGRQGNWDVPAVSGVVNEEFAGSIKIDGLPVLRGSSGAPVITEGGIIGMIVADTPQYTEITSLELIKHAFGTWDYPWQLADLSCPLGKNTTVISNETIDA